MAAGLIVHWLEQPDLRIDYNYIRQQFKSTFTIIKSYIPFPFNIKEILTAMRVMVVSIGSRGSHIPAMTPRRLRRGVIAGM